MQAQPYVALTNFAGQEYNIKRKKRAKVGGESVDLAEIPDSLPLTYTEAQKLLRLFIENPIGIA